MKKLGLPALLLAGLLFALPAGSTGSGSCACECADGCQCGENCQCACECADGCQCGENCQCACECADGCQCGENCECACECDAGRMVMQAASRCGGMNTASCGGCGR